MIATYTPGRQRIAPQHSRASAESQLLRGRLFESLFKGQRKWSVRSVCHRSDRHRHLEKGLEGPGAVFL